MERGNIEKRLETIKILKIHHNGILFDLLQEEESLKIDLEKLPIPKDCPEGCTCMKCEEK